MNRFTIHYCGEEKVINILIDGVLPTTAFTIGASGGIIEVPYSGCASSVTIDSSVTYTIDGANHKILLNMPSNSSDTERVFNFSVVWCNGNSTVAVITQAESNGFYQSIFDAPYSGCTLVASYHGCLSSITISGVSYSIDSTNKTVTFTVPPNQLEYDEMTYSAVVHWCDGEESNLSIIQEPFMPRSYLTFKTLTAGRYAFSYEDTYATVEYSLDGGEYWIPYTRSSWTPNIPAGSIILWRGNINPLRTSGNGVGNFGTMDSTTKFEAYGNPFSLSNRNSFETATLERNHFKLLFWKCKGLVSARNLALTATTLTTGCYEDMFKECPSLTTPPRVLPATTLASNCYQGMFAYCSGLTTAPTICATTMATSACTNMFRYCTALTTAPELPATTLASYCYAGMFAECINLLTPPRVLPATTLAERCYNAMFADCYSLTTAPELPATTLANYCYSGMFSLCGALTTAPELPATTLAQGCYYQMFYYCTSLTIAPELPATTLASYCYQYMFNNCQSLTTAPELPATTLASYCYDSMFVDCISLNYIKAMFTTTPSSTYTGNWVGNVASTGTFVKNSAATWTTTGDNGVPEDWTIEYADS